MAKDEKRVDLLLELVRAAHDKHLAEMRYQFVLEKLEEEKARSTRPQPTRFDADGLIWEGPLGREGIWKGVPTGSHLRL
jgi:hypothetical protein